MVQKKEKVEYTRPASQLDLEARLERDNESPLAVVRAENRRDVFGEDEPYVNVDPIYQNHANDTEAPLEAEEGVDKDAEDAFRESAAGKESDHSQDQQRSGPYVDSSDQGSAGAGSSPFTKSEGDSGDTKDEK